MNDRINGDGDFEMGSQPHFDIVNVIIPPPVDHSIRNLIFYLSIYIKMNVCLFARYAFGQSTCQ